MKPYCLQISANGKSHSVYEGASAWPACPIGHLRQAYDVERKDGHGPWIVFDTQDRPFSGDSPEKALDAFATRSMTRLTLI